MDFFAIVFAVAALFGIFRFWWWIGDNYFDQGD